MQLQTIQNKIYELRGLKVMLDFELAVLYETDTRTLKQTVKRNRFRFPGDFMFELSESEIIELVSQNVIPSKKHLGGASPFAFTEQGVAMLSSVLKSRKAIELNIAIMRAFVFIRQYALSHKDLTDKLKELEVKYDQKFEDVYEALRYLLQKDQIQTQQSQRKQIGYKP